MYKHLIVGVGVLLLSACGSTNNTNTTNTDTGSVDTGSVQQSQAPVALTGTKVFLIDLENSMSGSTVIGCGDGLATLDYDMSASQDPMYDTLAELLTLNPNNYSGYYNSLDNAQLTINSLAVNNGVAEVYLNGTLSLGGVCDNPRVQVQLEQTLLQFPGVQSVEIYINNTPLDQFLSLQ